MVSTNKTGSIAGALMSTSSFAQFLFISSKKTRKKLVVTILAIAMIFIASLAIADENSEFLSPDKAFALHARLLNEREFELNFSIAPGYLLYREHFELLSLSGQPIKNAEAIFPPALTKRDEVLGEDYKAYINEVKLLVPMIDPSPETERGFSVKYQGCSEGGFCYAPISKQVIALPNGTVNVTDLSPEPFTAIPYPEETPQIGSESDYIRDHLQTDAFPIVLLLFLGLGILLAFTPCILPMVPILANILVGENTPLSSRRATLLASLYVLSVAICYAFAGVMAGLMGAQLQTVLQKPIFLISLSFLLVLFALNQFNLIHVRLPQIFTQALHQLQHKQKQGSVIGAIAMGGISALMVSPCVTPALVGALTYIGQTGNAVLGGFALFAMALGMGLPLLIAACIGSHLLPKSGRWMGYIKVITGIFLLILSGSLLIRVFPQVLHTHTMVNLSTHFLPIQNEKEFKAALDTAKALQKVAILDVYADWCISCQQLDHEVFSNPEVLSTLKNVTLLRLDITKSTEANEALQKSLKIIGPPTLLFFSMNGEEAENYRFVGKVKSNNFIRQVQHFLQSQNK